MTRLGDLLDFLKPLTTINLPKSPTLLGNFVMVSKSIIFLVKLFMVNFNFFLVTLDTDKNLKQFREERTFDVVINQSIGPKNDVTKK